MIDVKGLERAEVVFALYEGTEAVGKGAWNGRKLTLEAIRKLMPENESTLVIDYLAGKPIKVEFHGDRLEREDLYDRDCPSGPGSCAKIIAALRVKHQKVLDGIPG